MNALRLSNWVPVNVCAGIVPLDPVNVGAELVPVGVKLTVPFVGTPAGHAIVPWLVIVTVPVAVVTGLTPVDVLPVTSFVPLLVEAATTALPVKVAVVPECVGTPAGQEIVSAGIVPLLPVKVGAEFVPAGVNATVELVPAGVMLSAPPVVPTLLFAATVPRAKRPLRLLNSVNPAGHADKDNTIMPEGIALLILVVTDV